MISLVRYSLTVGIPFFWPLEVCSASQRRFGLLRRITNTLHQGALPGMSGNSDLLVPEGISPEMAAGMKTFYTMERVGLQTNGVTQPRSPLDKKARMCLTVGPPDHLQGRALQLLGCSDADLTTEGMNKNESIQGIQAFHFLPDGRIRNMMTGLCIRRMLCGINPVYDLGPCDEDRTAAAWTVTKAIANQIDDTQFLGYPLSAVVKESCNMCGPYQLLQRCKGSPMASNWGCQDTVMKPGWSKLPVTTAVKDKDFNDVDVEGGGYGDVHKDVENMFDGIDSVDMGSADLSQYCGTFMTDGASPESWWYFLMVGT